MCDFVGPILEVLKFIYRPTKKYLNYHRNVNKFVDDFKQAQADLHVRKADIQQQLQDEHRFGTKPKQEVESWFKKAEKEFNRAQCVEDEVNKGKYLFRSCLGKVVDETTQAMKEVYAEGVFSGSLVVSDLLATKVELPTEELAGAIQVEEIYQYLMGDEVRKIGVCGMGGIGKTTIMKHVYNKLLEENKFSKLIWTTISQDFDIRRLQKKIAYQLDEEFSDNEDPVMRAAKLQVKLKKQGNYVLILDDVWSSFSLEDVGIPEPTAKNGGKLVLTTRSEEVVRSMSCKKVQLTCLLINEALQLFRSKVRQDVLPNPKIEATMKHIVEECAGLPLAIVTVAATMKGISDPLRWENALKKLRGQTRNMKDVEDKVFGCLIFSYEHLQPIDRYCFLDCALYPEDYEFQEEEIIERWIEDGLMDEMETRKETHDIGHDVLQKLQENSLLERVQNGAGMKMHDVIRDMALHITKTSPRFFVKAGTELIELPDEQQWTEDLEKVSLMRNSIAKIPPKMLSLKCEKLTTLLLSHNFLKDIPDSFFDHMPNLKILDLSRNPIVSLPNSLSNLENLTTLLLSYCVRLQIVPSFSKLKALKKLDLKRTFISKIPHGLELLVNLRYLNLGYTSRLEQIPNGLLSKSCRLRYLAIHTAVTRAEEMRELNKLEVFEGCFSNVNDLSVYVGQSKKLHKYMIWVSHELNICVSYFLLVAYMDYSKMVEFVDFDINSGDGIILPYDIQKLQVHRCKGMRSLNDISGLHATDLKECTVWYCNELESVFSSRCHQFETLESLKLQHLENLKAIIVEESSVATFSSLKKIYVEHCGKIKNLFSAKWVLHNLEEMDVESCDEMEEIIVSEEEGMVDNTNTFKYTLPKLLRLKLRNLPELKSICSKNGVLICDSLQYICIEDCPQLKRIPQDDLDKEKPLLNFSSGIIVTNVGYPVPYPAAIPIPMPTSITCTTIHTCHTHHLISPLPFLPQQTHHPLYTLQTHHQFP